MTTDHLGEVRLQVTGTRAEILGALSALNELLDLDPVAVVPAGTRSSEIRFNAAGRLRGASGSPRGRRR